MKTNDILIALTLVLASAIIAPLACHARIWTSSDGSKTFEGDLQAYDAASGQVTIVKDGATIVFNESKLSADDRAFLKKWSGEVGNQATAGWPVTKFDHRDEADIRKSWLFFSDGETRGGSASYTVKCSDGVLAISGVLNKGRIDPPFFLMMTMDPVKKSLRSTLVDSKVGLDTHSLVFRVKGNARKYKIYLSTADNITYGQEFAMPPGQTEWLDVRLPFKDFELYPKTPESNGKMLTESVLQKVSSFELKLRDGAYGAFDLELDQITVEKN